MYIREDEDTNVSHIANEDGTTLCGLMLGFTCVDHKPVKEKYGCTCKECQEEVYEIKKLRAKK